MIPGADLDVKMCRAPLELVVDAGWFGVVPREAHIHLGYQEGYPFIREQAPPSMLVPEVDGAAGLVYAAASRDRLSYSSHCGLNTKVDNAELFEPLRHDLEHGRGLHEFIHEFRCFEFHWASGAGFGRRPV